MHGPAGKIANLIVENLRGDDAIVGIVIYGSIARGDYDAYSDVDIAVYLRDESLRDIILNKIYYLLEKIDNIILFNIYDKYLFFLINNNIAIELKIHAYNKVVDDVIYIVQSRIKEPSKAVVYDPYGVLLSLIKLHWFTPDQPDIYEKEIRQLVQSFIYHIRLYVHYSRYRNDSFRAYMNYTIAMYKLAGLIAAAYGVKYNLYGPWYLFEKVVDDSLLAEHFYKIANMYATDPNTALSEIFHFLKIIKNIAYKHENNYIAKSIEYTINIIKKLINLKL